MTNIKLDGYFLEGVCDHCTRIKPVIAECNVFCPTRLRIFE